MANTALYDSDSEPEGSRYNDSDEESLVDVDSPADGYFERREHPQTTFIPNPATEPRSEEDKAREAAAERLSQQQQQHWRGGASGDGRQGERQRPPSHHSQPRSPVWAANEDTPLLDAGPAGPPPDYAAATADRRSGHGREGSYGSLSDSAFSSDHPLVRNGLLNEQGVFGQQRSEPQSMRDSFASSRGRLRGGGGSAEEERAGEERGFVRRQWDRDWNGRKRWTRHFRARRLLTWLFVIGLLVLILTLSGAFGDAQDNGSYPSDGNGRKTPEPFPAYPGDGDDDGHNEPKDPTKNTPMPPHKSTAQCKYTTFSTPEEISFASPANFSFVEFIENPAERALFSDRITGTIQVSAAPSSQSAAIVVWISVAISGTLHFERLRKITDADGLELLFPDVSGDVEMNGVESASSRWYGSEGNCLDFSVAVLVKPGITLHNLDLSTANFDVRFEHGVFEAEEDVVEEVDETATYTTSRAVTNFDHAALTAVRGKIHAQYFSSRETYVYATSSRISGTWALRDLLYIDSVSGGVDIEVDPKNASAEDPEHAAEFHCKSKSGNVKVGYPTDAVGGEAIPERDYHTRVETTSASIKGSYILGSDARFDTNSGAMDFTVLPYYAERASALHTSTLSANTKLRVLSPYMSESTSIQNARAGVLGYLHSAHKSTSGSLKLTYPDEWEGVIDGQSVSGAIKVRGEDVEVLVDDDIGKTIPGGHGKSVMKHVVARKGYGESRMGFSTTSGSVNILVGRA